MPILDSTIPKEQMEILAENHVCQQCGAGLSVCWGGAYKHNGFMLRCSRDPQHEGLIRKYVPTIFEIAQGVKEMESKALAQRNNITNLSQEKAGEILTTFWPKASQEARLKGAMVCSMYGLNPLMNHVALMKFTGKDGKDEWVVALEIKANRILARRQGAFSYLDMTPRAMTEDEQKQVFGEVLTDRYAAITKLQDDDGHKAPGYGVWPKSKPVYGADKGNTPQNMANIRSERQALDRLFPDALPQSVEVFDAEYTVTGEDTGDGNSTGEIDESPSSLWDTEDAPPPVTQEPAFKNVGEFFAYCYGKHGISSSTVMASLGVSVPKDIVNFTVAKAKIDKEFGEG